MRYTPWYCRNKTSLVRTDVLLCGSCGRSPGRRLPLDKQEELTFSVLAEIQQLVTPLRDYTQRIFQEGDDDQETADRWEVSGKRSRKTPSVP